jgi:oxygen-independent coproporphyrinogen-3 oxidase
LAVSALGPDELRRADVVVADGLLARRVDRLVLTDRGRLLADGVVRTLLYG